MPQKTFPRTPRGPAPAALASAVRELVAKIANRLDWLHTARGEGKA
ncbi:hypothetical protein [Streptomyces sp. f150]|nr:hypothetical protein [Streptomyces sp. f150]